MAGGMIAILLLLSWHALAALLAAALVVASLELQGMLIPERNSRQRVLVGLVTTCAALLPVIPIGASPLLSWQGSIGVGAALIAGGAIFAGTEDLSDRLRRLCADGFGLLYLSLTFPTLLELRLLEGEAGWGLVFLAMLITFGGDTGGYFAGRAFGRRRLAPVLSPKKTWEGYFGGLLLGAAGVAAARQFPACSSLSSLDLFILSGVGVSLGVLGDLFESLIKRGAKVKDSGQLIPGHGGILDRIDGLLFVAPFVLFYLQQLRGVVNA